MMDGSDFDWDNEDHPSALYEGREPRFYATFLLERSTSGYLVLPPTSLGIHWEQSQTGTMK